MKPLTPASPPAVQKAAGSADASSQARSGERESVISDGGLPARRDTLIEAGSMAAAASTTAS
jgi:hypothetical protein